MKNEFDVVDLILIDHKILKSCIEKLTDEELSKKTKLSAGKEFLAVLKPHSEAEKNAIYASLRDNKELHRSILEGEIEHGIADEKVHFLESKIMTATELNDELEAELKVLAELVKHHIKEEENVMLPKIRAELDDYEMEALTLMFADFRNFSKSQIANSPRLSDELNHWLKTEAVLSKRYVKNAEKVIKTLQF